jgi:hypothetical protein
MCHRGQADVVDEKRIDVLWRMQGRFHQLGQPPRDPIVYARTRWDRPILTLLGV